MTREDISRSLKPIRWTYSHEFGSYEATLGAGDVCLRIEPQIGNKDKPYLIAHRGRNVIFDRSMPFDTLDEAMAAARGILIDEVCNLFEIDQ